MAALTGLEGVYNWRYAGGSFQVELRPFGSFYCKSYPATASWTLVDKVVSVDWKKFGKYELEIKDPSTKSLEGGLAGNPSNWRKAEFVRPFSEAELRLLSGGSVWNFEYDQGSFEVQFHADGYNHFVCNAYPSHSHWSMEGDKLTINWGSYGDYILTVDPNGTTMAGHKVGQPDNWRKATYLRPLGPEGLALPDMDHH
eukprot:CAMPEP_0113680574 /NCGR_PEP_ID=MMETSP0038_2-20120614/11415_1 /TAXON_ID=2898 /ORGANISM="Cryptomonas paramecium" /LENGTH=197 /DNA_ID=CAMNT_0000599011 /DNA_START=6 /DNA_END=599 /DNA_ORIENTATION=- /assembly_acc=CAM_ASM_000170